MLHNHRAGFIHNENDISCSAQVGGRGGDDDPGATRSNSATIFQNAPAGICEQGVGEQMAEGDGWRWEMDGRGRWMAEGDGWRREVDGGGRWMGWKGVGEEEIGEDREEREATRKRERKAEWELEEGKIGKIGVNLERE